MSVRSDAERIEFKRAELRRAQELSGEFAGMVAPDRVWSPTFTGVEWLPVRRGPLNVGVHRVAADPTWRTPAKVFSELDAEFDFTLDPAASSPIKPGIEWFGEADHGLWREWSGRVFVNPPYGRAIQDWMRKITLERARCEVIVALVPCRTDTEWWHEHAMPADEIRFIRGRLSFEGVDAPKGHNAPFPSAILVYR